MDGVEATERAITSGPTVVVNDDRGERPGNADADEDADEPPAGLEPADLEPADLEPADLERWERLATDVLVHEGIGAMDVSITFVDAATIAELKREHLDGDGAATDVLAFPIDEPGSAADGSPPGVPLVLGDVVICPSVAAGQAAEHAGSYDDEVALLVVHGLLHLLGMDHADDTDRLAMQQRERELLGAFHGPLAGDPWRSVPS
jgi:probable rRNA maturation factor